LAKQAALAKKEAAGDFSHLKNKKGQLIANPLPQPTLPNVSLEDDNASSMRMRQGQYAPSNPGTDWHSDYKAGTDYGSGGQGSHPDYPDYPPPMPEYQPYSHIQPQGAYTTYGQSVTTLPQDELYDKYDAESDYGSTAHLPDGAAPFEHEAHEQHNRIHSYTSGKSLPNPYAIAASNVPSPMSEAYGGYVRQDHHHSPGQYDSRHDHSGTRR